MIDDKCNISPDDYEIVLPDDMDCSNIKLTPAIKQYSIWRVKEFFYLTE